MRDDYQKLPDATKGFAPRFLCGTALDKKEDQLVCYDIALLAVKVLAIRPVLSPALSPVIVEKVTQHRESILSCADPVRILDYINRATDAECLSALYEIYLSAPLNDGYYHLFSYLAVTVYTEAGLGIPEGVQELGSQVLTEKLSVELESFRRGIRITQQRTLAKGAHQ